MKIFSLLLLGCCIHSRALAEPELTAEILSTGQGQTNSTGTISLRVKDANAPLEEPILLSSSLATNVASVELYSVGDDGETPVELASIDYRDADQDGRVSALNLHTSETLNQNALYRIHLNGSPSRPAVTAVLPDGSRKVFTGPLDLSTGKINPVDGDFLNRSRALRSSIEFGGGSDGALASLKLRYGYAKLDSEHLLRLTAMLDASLSPEGDSLASLSSLYSNVDAEVNLIGQTLLPEDSVLDGCIFYGLDSRFDSTQNFRNYDGSLGVTTWFFVNFGLLNSFSDLLHLNGSSGGHPLALQIAGDHVFASERQAGLQENAEWQVRLHLIWMARLLSKVSLPLWEDPFHVNLLVDVSASWRPEDSKVFPETRLSLEFNPVRFEKQELAFTLTYASGSFSPTFVNENALLAGLKWRF